MSKFKILILAIPLLLITETADAQNKKRRKVNQDLMAYIENAPDSLYLDYDWIVEYLKAPTKNERELVESIFYWIADNITYDFKAYATGSYGSQSAVETIISKKAVCSGYARLFHELCIRSGLESEVIGGHGKGLGYQVGEEWSINHAWNVVKVAGEWQLIDVTWGSGGGMENDDGFQYVKNLDLTYLFADPENFILTHFPEDQKWQLLEKPISKEVYFSSDFEVKRMNN